MTQTTDLATDLATAFREAFRHQPAGVAIVTADPGTGPVAMTVSSLISISADPPSVAFSLSSRSGSTPAVLEAGSMVIHFLRYGDRELGQLAATPGADRFGPGVDWQRLPGGEPRYTRVAIWFRARITGTLPAPGATVVVAELLEGHGGPAGPHHAPEQDPLIYLDRRWHRLHDQRDGVTSLMPVDADPTHVFR